MLLWKRKLNRIKIKSKSSKVYEWYKCNYYVITLYGGKVVITDEYVLGEKIIDVSRNSYVYIDGAESVGWATDVYPSKDTWMEVYVHRIQGNGGTNVGCVGLSDSADWRMFIY